MAAGLEATGRFTSVPLPSYWHVAALAREVRTKPVARTVLGVPVVLFRDRSGRVAALADRCPHRNVPLSLGRCVEDSVECRYHGWRFGADGACLAVPGLDETGETDRPVRRAHSFPVLERDGLVWVVIEGEPARATPPTLAGVGEPGYRSIELALDVPGPMLAAVENALDVPHTSFLHRGLFRGRRERVPVNVTLRHGEDFVEAEFEGEPLPPGVIARVLSPDGGVIEHVDRFVVPSLAQVDYRLGERHVVLNAFYTPVDDRSCRLHAVAAYKVPIPEPVARNLVLPLARWILHQDNWVLRHQRDSIERFGGEQFVNTPIDLLGPSILRLLRHHQRGETSREPVTDEHRTLLT